MPAANPGITDDERRTIAEMMARGTYATIVLATKDLDATFGRLQSGNADIVQEPTEQPYGIRDCAVRDPAGTMIRIQQLAQAVVGSLSLTSILPMFAPVNSPLRASTQDSMPSKTVSRCLIRLHVPIAGPPPRPRRSDPIDRAR